MFIYKDHLAKFVAVVPFILLLSLFVTATADAQVTRQMIGAAGQNDFVLQCMQD